MKKNTILLAALLTFVFTELSAQTNFDFDTNTTSTNGGGDSVSEEIDGITMTLTGASDLRLFAGNGFGGSSGNIALTTIKPTSVTITFSDPVYMYSIRPLSATGETVTYTLTPDGDNSRAVDVALTGGTLPNDDPVTLNWESVTSVVVTSSAGSSNYTFDDIFVSKRPPLPFDFDTNTTVDSGSVSEEIDGITMTLTGAPDLRLFAGNGFGGSSGNIALTTIKPTSVTITFSEPVYMYSIRPLSATGETVTYTLTPDGDNSRAVDVALTGGRLPNDDPVTLNWESVTSVVVTSSAGSSNYTFDDIWAINDFVASTNEVGINSVDIVMYPNPTSDVFYIKGLKAKRKLSIYDIQGKLMLKEDEYLDNTIIDISRFKSGLYLVELKSNNGVLVKRLVKH